MIAASSATSTIALSPAIKGNEDTRKPSVSALGRADLIEWKSFAHGELLRVEDDGIWRDASLLRTGATVVFCAIEDVHHDASNAFKVLFACVCVCVCLYV